MNLITKKDHNKWKLSYRAYRSEISLSARGYKGILYSNFLGEGQKKNRPVYEEKVIIFLEIKLLLLLTTSVW